MAYCGVQSSRARWRAAGFELQLPVKVLDQIVVLAVHGAHARFAIADDGAITGVLGGAFDVDEVVTRLSMYAIGDQLKMSLPGLLGGISDLAKAPATMQCRQFSMAMTIDAKPAFLNP